MLNLRRREAEPLAEDLHELRHQLQQSFQIHLGKSRRREIGRVQIRRQRGSQLIHLLVVDPEVALHVERRRRGAQGVQGQQYFGILNVARIEVVFGRAEENLGSDLEHVHEGVVRFDAETKKIPRERQSEITFQQAVAAHVALQVDGSAVELGQLGFRQHLGLRATLVVIAGHHRRSQLNADHRHAHE